MDKIKDQGGWTGLLPKWPRSTTTPPNPLDAEVNACQPPPVWEKVEAASGGEGPGPRTKFSSVVYEGKMLVFGGGYVVTFHSDLYEYTFETRQWRCVQADASILPNGPCKRRSHKAVLWKKEMVVFGGRTQYGRKNDVHLLNLETYGWTKRVAREGAAAPVERAAHTACLWGDEMVVFGGDKADESQMFLSDLWCYHCERDEWREVEGKGAVPSGRLGHSCGVRDDTMYLFGGFNGHALNDMYACHLPTGNWRRIMYDCTVRPASFIAMVEEKDPAHLLQAATTSSKTPCPPSASTTSTSLQPAATLHKNGTKALLLWGGAYTDIYAFSDTLYRFNCETEEFEIIKTGGEKPCKRLGHTMVLENESKLLLFGGSDRSYFNDIFNIDLKRPSLKEHLRHWILSLGVPYKPAVWYKHDPYASPPNGAAKKKAPPFLFKFLS